MNIRDAPASHRATTYPDDAMSSPAPDIRTLLELYADGELPEADVPTVERALAEDPAAGEYLAALAELRDAVRAPIEHATESIAFDGLFARVMADVDAAATRTEASDSLAHRWLDGEELATDEAARAEAYIEASPEWSAHAGAVRELGEIVRASIEPAVEAADFALMREKVNAELDAWEASKAASSTAAREAAEAAARPGLWARMADFFGAHRGIMASAVTAMLVAAVMVPLLGRDGDVEIHNHYPIIDGVEYQKGYSGTIVPHGTKSAGDAPIVWFEPAEGSADADAAAAIAEGSADGTGEATAPAIFEKGGGEEK